MNSRPARTPLTSNERELAQELCHALERALGSSFSIWQQQNGWHPWSATSPPSSESLPDAAVIRQGLEQQTLPKAATSWQLPDGCQLLVVPIAQHRDRQVVVAGTVGPCPTGVLLSLADTTLAYLLQQRESAEAGRRINRYLSQITADFEELTWLRNISQHFEFCDIRKDLVDVARTCAPLVAAPDLCGSDLSVRNAR